MFCACVSDFCGSLNRHSYTWKRTANIRRLMTGSLMLAIRRAPAVWVPRCVIIWFDIFSMGGILWLYQTQGLFKICAPDTDVTWFSRRSGSHRHIHTLSHTHTSFFPYPLKEKTLLKSCNSFLYIFLNFNLNLSFNLVKIHVYAIFSFQIYFRSRATD